MPSAARFLFMGCSGRSSAAFSISSSSTAALAQPRGRMGPIFSLRWSCGGARTMPSMSASDCTARWRKLEPGCTVIFAFSASAANSGSAKSHLMSSSDSSPSMEPALWEIITRSAKGPCSSPPRFTMLQR